MDKGVATSAAFAYYSFNTSSKYQPEKATYIKIEGTTNRNCYKTKHSSTMESLGNFIVISKKLIHSTKYSRSIFKLKLSLLL